MTFAYPLGSDRLVSDDNTAALDQYARGWGRGDTSIIYPVLDRSYTFTMTGMDEPVKLDNFKQFFVQFRKEVEAGGGPGIESDVFMKFTNVIRRQVKCGTKIMQGLTILY